MIYYTVYVKGLRNSTGYIDVALKDDQLLKDFQQFLDLGLKASRIYPVVDPGGASATRGSFTVNLAEVSAITTVIPS
jgi:hypothetical protein